MQTLMIPQPLTVADLDAEMDFSALDEALEAARPYGCRSIEFVDDNHKRGYRALEYTVSVVARHEHDEDGCSPVYESYPISAKVTHTMPLTTLVYLLIGDINALIES